MSGVRRLRRPIAALLALTLALAAVPTHGGQAAAEGSITLDQLMGALRTVRHVDARYVERRYLHVLRTPIETRGDLHFDAPDHLEKAADAPPDGAAERLRIDGDRLTIDRGAGASTVVLSLAAHPEIGVLVESIRATLSGDTEALRRTFDLTIAGTLSQWELVLQPRDPAERQILQWMRIDGHGARITAIETQEHDCDRSEMTIVERTP
jgi:hypothetical protein